MIVKSFQKRKSCYKEEKSTLYAYHDKKDMMMLSYIDKKESGKKYIVVLTTMHGEP